MPRNIDEYIAGFPPEVQRRLRRIRATVRKAAPDAKEAIKYQIPTLTLTRNLIHFAAYENHIGLYPAPRDAEEFRAELAKYEGGKGTLRFPHDEALPLGLIARIVKFRAKQERAKAKKKR